MQVPYYCAVLPLNPEAGERWRTFVAATGLRHLLEVVSADHTLCPALITTPVPEDWAHVVNADGMIHLFVDLPYLLSRTAGQARRQILALWYLNPDDPAPRPIDGFEFLGYDLIEETGSISALTNCGGFPLAFAPVALNVHGLLPDLQTARYIADQLRHHYPDEPHARCRIIGIARMNDPRKANKP